MFAYVNNQQLFRQGALLQLHARPQLPRYGLLWARARHAPWRWAQLAATWRRWVCRTQALRQGVVNNGGSTMTTVGWTIYGWIRLLVIETLVFRCHLCLFLVFQAVKKPITRNSCDKQVWTSDLFKNTASYQKSTQRNRFENTRVNIDQLINSSRTYKPGDVLLTSWLQGAESTRGLFHGCHRLHIPRKWSLQEIPTEKRSRLGMVPGNPSTNMRSETRRLEGKGPKVGKLTDCTETSDTQQLKHTSIKYQVSI